MWLPEWVDSKFGPWWAHEHCVRSKGPTWQSKHLFPLYPRSSACKAAHLLKSTWLLFVTFSQKQTQMNLKQTTKRKIQIISIGTSESSFSWASPQDSEHLMLALRHKSGGHNTSPVAYWFGIVKNCKQRKRQKGNLKLNALQSVLTQFEKQNV